VLPFAGCSEDPEAVEARHIRQETAGAMEMVGRNTDSETLQSARNKVQSSLVKNRQAAAATKDAAYLASGNLALAHGRGKQIDLELAILPVRRAVRQLERTLRSAESLLLEKERTRGLLDSDLEEKTQLEQLVIGTPEKAGLTEQLEAAQAKLDELQEQKARQVAEQEKTQAVLDDYQSRADTLLRKAELASGDEKLQLQKQAYAILMDRKESYVDAQTSEDMIAMLDSRIELAKSQVDSFTQSIESTQGRIEAIDVSPTAGALKQQLGQVEQELAVTQQQLVTDAQAVTAELEAFRNAAQEVSGIFEEAISEFEKVSTRNAAFSADLQLAESYHRAAAVHAAVIRLQLDTSERLVDLVNSADNPDQPMFANLLREQLPLSIEIDPAAAERVMGFYDQAIEAYQKALDGAGAMGQDAQSSVLKSELLAVDSKMRLADRLNLPEAAEQADLKRQELMAKGEEYGVSFTQSETLKLVEFGIDYTPELPVNLEVLAEELEARFSAWKRLPLDQQEAAVEANLAEIDQFINRYGETLGARLEPLKQDMLAARERGYEAPVGPAGTGVGDPNSF
jgi:tetratricopeptide (TPR) repeat protein